MEYFALVFSLAATFVVSESLISMAAVFRSPSAWSESLPGSATMLTDSETMSASLIASLKSAESASMFTGKLSSGTFWSFSSMSIIGRLNVLVDADLSCILSLLASSSSVSMSVGLARLSICLRFVRFMAISAGFSTSYSVNAVGRSLKITIATFAGSIATSSMPSLEILSFASFTSSEIIDMLSFKYFGSASVSLIF